MQTARDLPAPFYFRARAILQAVFAPKICAFSDKIAPIGAGDNDWLGLTSDDQRRV
jgi:hypothetical protein